MAISIEGRSEYRQLLSVAMVAVIVQTAGRVEADTQVSTQPRAQLSIPNFESRGMVDGDTFVGIRDRDVYAVKRDGTYKLVFNDPIGEVPGSFGVVHAAGDFVVGKRMYRFFRTRISDPSQEAEITAPNNFTGGTNSYVSGVAENGCVFGHVFPPGTVKTRGAIWCDDMASPTILGNNAGSENVVALDIPTGLIGIDSRIQEDSGDGGSFEKTFSFVESTVDGSRYQINFDDGGPVVNSQLFAVKSTLFNDDRPGAFTVAVSENSVLKLKMYNAINVPSSAQWVGETIEVATSVRFAALTDRFLVYSTGNKCKVLSFDGSRTTLRSSGGGTYSNCYGARETIKNLEVVRSYAVTGPVRFTYKIQRTDIDDLSSSEVTELEDYLRNCTEHRLIQRSDHERDARFAGTRWSEIKFPRKVNSCRKKASRRFAVMVSTVKHHHRELMTEGVAGNSTASLRSIARPLRDAIDALESCVGNFGSTDKKLIWRCAKQVGESGDLGIGALDSLKLYNKISNQGYPPTY